MIFTVPNFATRVTATARGRRILGSVVVLLLAAVTALVTSPRTAMVAAAYVVLGALSGSRVVHSGAFATYAIATSFLVHAEFNGLVREFAFLGCGILLGALVQWLAAAHDRQGISGKSSSESIE